MYAITAFIQGDMKEDAYVERPAILQVPMKYVLKFRKSLYG